MRRRKKHIRPWLIVVIVLVVLASSVAGGNYLVSEKNYAVNVVTASTFDSSNFTSQGYLNATTKLINFDYAATSDITQYSIIVATYNALNYLKRDGSYTGTVNSTILPDIIKYYDLYAELGFGYFGVNPLAVTWYFKSLGLNAEITFDRENIKTRMAQNTVSILYRNGENIITGEKDIEFRAATYTSFTDAQYYGPNMSFNIGNLINITYADYFLALISINV